MLLLFITLKLCFYSSVCTCKRSILCSLDNQKSVKRIFCQKIQMYQLSRLLHDYHRDLYCHLEQQDIAPSLYAPPWFLTTFASQYPLGFVARVFGEFGGNGSMYLKYLIRAQTSGDNGFFCTITGVNITTPTGVCSKCVPVSYTAKVGR